MSPFSFFRSKSPQLDLGDENDPSVPLETDPTASMNGDTPGKKQFWMCDRRSSPLAERAPANSTLFFGFCDMRIATVLLNILHIIFTFLLEVSDASNWTHEKLPVLAIIGFIFSGLGVFGALNFNIFAVIVSTIGLIALFWLYVTEIHLFGCAILCLILFAQVALIVEMRKGIMTRETYAEQESMVAGGRQPSDVADTSKEVAV